MTNNGTRIVLGTAQLGMPYGIANTTGQPDLTGATKIVSSAWASSVRYFDTAQAYGMSEMVLGQALRTLGVGGEARVITKLPPTLDTSNGDILLAHLRSSLARLGLEQLWGVLLHREEQLDDWDGILGRTLAHAKEDGLIGHAGVSVYSPSRARQALEHDDLDMLQVPANVFDRRMVRAGVFAEATRRGAQIFIRSVYLQGMALLSPDRVAEVVPFAVPAVQRLTQFCRAHDVDRQQFVLGYALALDPRALAVVGAETPAQIADNCLRAKEPPLPPTLCRQWDEAWPDDEELLINPSRWPSCAAA